MLVAAGIQIVRAIGIKTTDPDSCGGRIGVGISGKPRPVERRSAGGIIRIVVSAGEQKAAVRANGFQVTQRPGSSSLATSVNTLTTGSHATFRSPGLANKVSRAAWATGTRTSTDVSERPSSRSEIVCVRAADAGTPAARSALAARLMPAPADYQGNLQNGDCETRPRSRPEANCTAPNVSETADAPRIPLNRAWLETCDMLRPPSFVAPRRSDKQRDGNREVLRVGHHLTVYEKKSWRRGTTPGAARHPASRLFPLPH